MRNRDIGFFVDEYEELARAMNAAQKVASGLPVSNPLRTVGGIDKKGRLIRPSIDHKRPRTPAGIRAHPLIAEEVEAALARHRKHNKGARQFERLTMNRKKIRLALQGRGSSPLMAKSGNIIRGERPQVVFGFVKNPATV